MYIRLYRTKMCNGQHFSSCSFPKAEWSGKDKTSTYICRYIDEDLPPAFHFLDTLKKLSWKASDVIRSAAPETIRTGIENSESEPPVPWGSTTLAPSRNGGGAISMGRPAQPMGRPAQRDEIVALSNHGQTSRATPTNS